MSIKSVAREANVSVATVSRVLNNSDKVTEDTRNQVLKAIRKLNYTPNLNAKQLRENNSRTIMVVVPDMINPVYGLMVNSVISYLKTKGYGCIININPDKNSDVSEYQFMLESKKVEGIIFLSSSINKKTFMKLYKLYNVVICSEYYSDSDIETIGVNQDMAMYDLLKHIFLQRGVKKPVYFTWEIPTTTSSERMNGYKRFFKEYKIKNVNSHTEKIGYSDFEEFSQKLKNRIENDKSLDAVIVNGDHFALYAHRIVKESNRNIVVCSLAGTFLMEAMGEGMVYVKQPFGKMGEEAAKIMLHKLSNEHYEKKKFFDYELVCH